MLGPSCAVSSGVRWQHQGGEPVSKLSIVRACILGAVLMSVAMVSHVNADILIDSFDDAQSVSATSVSTPVIDFLAAPGSWIGSGIGAGRRLKADHFGGANSVDLVSDAAGSGVLSYNTGADTTGFASARWGPLGGFDLTDGGVLDRLQLNVLFDDLPANATLVIEDGGGIVGGTVVALPGGIFSSTTFDLPYASVTNGVDVTDVVNMWLAISSPFPAADVQVDWVQSTTPEPATLSLLAFGGMALLRRRR